MHNLHLIVTTAANAEDACHDAECYISDWGNENNWRQICGCVSENNEVYIHEKDGRFPPDETSNTIEKINEKVNGWLNPDEYHEERAEKTMKEYLAGKKIDYDAWYSVEKFAQEMYEAGKTKKFQEKKSFDVFKDELFSTQYDENGVTHTGYAEEPGYKKYVVFVDMHS